MIRSLVELEELLSRPYEEDREALAALEGDLLLLGAGGKMGPTLAMRAKRAAPGKRIIAASRFSDQRAAGALNAAGVEVIPADLLDDRDLRNLPDVPNIIFLAGMKFGTSGDPSSTWARNVLLPAKCAERFNGARWVVLSSGNIYPLTRFGATENTPTAPVGEYAQTVLGRERAFQFYQASAVFVRLNYAVEMRYGVLLDIGTKVFERKPVDLAMGRFNCIWQGDANSAVLRSFGRTGALNLTGPETVSVRWAAERFGEIFGTRPIFSGEEGETALLSNAARCHRIFGYPKVSLEQIIEWTAAWIGMGGETLGKPTKFEVTDGTF